MIRHAPAEAGIHSKETCRKEPEILAFIFEFRLRRTAFAGMTFCCETTPKEIP